MHSSIDAEPFAVAAMAVTLYGKDDEDSKDSRKRFH
jgi:hypothetical protein